MTQRRLKHLGLVGPLAVGHELFGLEGLAVFLPVDVGDGGGHDAGSEIRPFLAERFNQIERHPFGELPGCHLCQHDVWVREAQGQSEAKVEAPLWPLL